MEKATFAARHAWDNGFWLAFVATSWLAIMMGFWAPVAQRYAGDAPYAAPTILVAHVFVYCGWIVLLSTQVLLVNRRRIDWHRQLGIAGAALAVLVTATGLGAEIYSQRFWAQADPENVRFFTFPLYVLIAFSICAYLAVRARRDPATHKRWMLLATSALMGGPYQRWWGEAIDQVTGTGVFRDWAHLYTGMNMLMILTAGYDLVTRGTIHRVNRIAVPLLVVGQIAAMAIWYSDWWPPLVRSILGIPPI